MSLQSLTHPIKAKKSFIASTQIIIIELEFLAILASKKNMTKRQNFTTGGPWEDIIGYCRAVKIGNTIEISGTTATKDDNGNDLTTMFDQTKAIIEKLAKVLEDAGASIENVVRTRLFLADITQWEEAAKAHGLFFKDIKPASTMLEVSKLIDPAMLIEIEMSAVID